jgi:hypothetical protein
MLSRRFFSFLCACACTSGRLVKCNSASDNANMVALGQKSATTKTKNHIPHHHQAYTRVNFILVGPKSGKHDRNFEVGGVSSDFVKNGSLNDPIKQARLYCYYFCVLLCLT